MPSAGLVACYCGSDALYTLSLYFDAPQQMLTSGGYTPSSCFLSRASGLLAPVLAEVLYDKGPAWPLAAFVPSMILVAIASGKLISQRKHVRCAMRKPSSLSGSPKSLPQFHLSSFEERSYACAPARNASLSCLSLP